MEINLDADIRMTEHINKSINYLAKRGEEGVLFTATGDTALVICNYAEPLHEEIEPFKENMNIQLRITKINGIVWLVFKTGKISWTATPFDGAKSSPLSVKDHMNIVFIMRDADTGEILAIRENSLPRKFSRALSQALNEVASCSKSIAEQNRIIDQTMEIMTSKDLAAIADAKAKITE